jgi:hypothetical protein
VSGYTPVFRSVFTGSLCGQWPDTAAWLSLLALADKNGHVDMTPQYIASVTGMPIAELQACIDRFLQPDPMSRSSTSDGRRLELLEPSRQWGWRIVNFSTYREKARLAAKNQREIESGKNSARMDDRRPPPETAGDRRSPPPTAPHTQTHTQTQEGESASRSVRLKAVTRVFEHWRTTHRHERAQLDDKRRKVISKALENYSEADLCQAITGYVNSPHHMGDNETGTVYDALELMLRDAKHIDAGLRFYAEPPRTDLSRATRRVIAQTDDWVPPEARRAG